MTRTRHSAPVYVPPTYEQYLSSFEGSLARLVADVTAMTSESELTQAHLTSFGYLFNTANAHLFWSKDRIVEAFASLNTGFVTCLDCCPVAYKREGVWAAKFGAEEVITDIRMMTRSAAAEWIIDHGHKVGYTPGQIEKARLDKKSLRRRAA